MFGFISSMIALGSTYMVPRSATPSSSSDHVLTTTTLSLDLMEIDMLVMPQGTKRKFSEVWETTQQGARKRARINDKPMPTAQLVANERQERKTMRDCRLIFESADERKTVAESLFKESAVKAIFYRMANNSGSFNFAAMSSSSSTTTTTTALINVSPSVSATMLRFNGGASTAITHDDSTMEDVNNTTVEQVCEMNDAPPMENDLVHSSSLASSSSSPSLSVVEPMADAPPLTPLCPISSPPSPTISIDSASSVSSISTAATSVSDFGQSPHTSESLKATLRQWNKAQAVAKKTTKRKVDGERAPAHSKKAQTPLRNAPQVTVSEVRSFSSKLTGLIRSRQKPSEDDDLVKSFKNTLVNDPLADAQDYVGFGQAEDTDYQGIQSEQNKPTNLIAKEATNLAAKTRDELNTNPFADVGNEVLFTPESGTADAEYSAADLQRPARSLRTPKACDQEDDGESLFIPETMPETMPESRCLIEHNVAHQSLKAGIDDLLGKAYQEAQKAKLRLKKGAARQAHKSTGISKKPTGIIKHQAKPKDTPRRALNKKCIFDEESDSEDEQKVVTPPAAKSAKSAKSKTLDADNLSSSPGTMTLAFRGPPSSARFRSSSNSKKPKSTTTSSAPNTVKTTTSTSNAVKTTTSTSNAVKTTTSTSNAVKTTTSTSNTVKTTTSTSNAVKKTKKLLPPRRPRQAEKPVSDLVKQILAPRAAGSAPYIEEPLVDYIDGM